MVIMASGIAGGRVRTTTTAAMESRNMAAILQIIGCQRHTALICRVLLWYWTSMLWSTDTCQNRVSADRFSRGHIAGSSLELIKVTWFFWSWPLTTCRDWIVGSCQVDLLKTEQDCSEAGLKIKSQQNYNFVFYRNVVCCFLLCIWWLLKLKTESQTIYRKPHRKVTKLKSKSYLFLG